MESAPEVGNAFTHAYPDWREGTYEMFKGWAAKQFGDSTADDEANVPVQYLKAKNISFKRNQSGDLILPPMSDYKKLCQKKRIIHAYVGAVYRESIQSIFLSHFLREIIGDFTGSSTSAFPYSLSAKENQTIFSPECVPDGFCLSDPDHLTALKTNLLYTHWLEQQDNGLTPFIILNASPLHGTFEKKSKKGKGKAKMNYTDVDSDDEDAPGDKKEMDKEEEEKTDDEMDNDNDMREDEEKQKDTSSSDDKDEEEKEDANKNGENSESEDEVTKVLARGDAHFNNDRHVNGTKAHKEKHPVTKYGPPISTQKKIPSSTQYTTYPGSVAGPSTIPPLKHASKDLKAHKASKPLILQSQPAIARKPAPLITETTLNVSKPSQTLLKTRSDGNNV